MDTETRELIVELCRLLNESCTGKHHVEHNYTRTFSISKSKDNGVVSCSIDNQEIFKDTSTISSWVESLLHRDSPSSEHTRLISSVVERIKRSVRYDEFQTLLYAHVDFFIQVIAKPLMNDIAEEFDRDGTYLSSKRNDNGTILFTIIHPESPPSYFTFYPDNPDRSLGGIESYVRHLTHFGYRGVHHTQVNEEYKELLTSMFFEALQPNADWISVMSRATFPKQNNFLDFP
jgi:hypothetical protein